MELNEFWSIVDYLNWGDICKDYTEGKIKNPNDEVELLAYEKFENDGGVLKANEFMSTLKEMEALLDMKFKSEKVKMAVGDDSWWDIRANIVGLGKESFDFAMKYPEAIPAMYGVHEAHWRGAGFPAVKFFENFEYGINAYITKASSGNRFNVCRREVRTYLETLYCPDCGTVMKFESETGPYNPGKFVHKCPECGTTSIEDKKYPSIEYEKIE